MLQLFDDCFQGGHIHNVWRLYVHLVTQLARNLVAVGDCGELPILVVDLLVQLVQPGLQVGQGRCCAARVILGDGETSRRPAARQLALRHMQQLGHMQQSMPLTVPNTATMRPQVHFQEKSFRTPHNDHYSRPSIVIFSRCMMSTCTTAATHLKPDARVAARLYTAPSRKTEFK